MILSTSCRQGAVSTTSLQTGGQIVDRAPPAVSPWQTTPIVTETARLMLRSMRR
jgi:hypothetical protein